MSVSKQPVVYDSDDNSHDDCVNMTVVDHTYTETVIDLPPVVPILYAQGLA